MWFSVSTTYTSLRLRCGFLQTDVRIYFLSSAAYIVEYLAVVAKCVSAFLYRMRSWIILQTLQYSLFCLSVGCAYTAHLPAHKLPHCRFSPLCQTFHIYISSNIPPTFQASSKAHVCWIFPSSWPWGAQSWLLSSALISVIFVASVVPLSFPPHHLRYLP